MEIFKKDKKQDDEVWELVGLIDELNFKKLEMMDEGSIKGKIWSKVESHVSSVTMGDLHELASVVKDSTDSEVSSLKKALIKERVMEYIENVRVGTRSVFSMKRFWGTAMLLAFFAFIFYPELRFFPSVSAEKNTYIEVVQGQVDVIRGDEVISVKDDTILQEGDSVKVYDGSLAQVYFVDDSRMAIGPASEISFDKIYVDEKNDTLTQVEVSVESGNVWVQVINLTGEEDYFSVLIKDCEFKIDRAADLNVSVSETDVLVQAVKYLAAFDITGSIDRDGILGEGTQLKIVDGMDLVIDSIPDISSDVWFDYNLTQDENHLKNVTDYYITESAQDLHLLSKDPLYSLKKFQEVVRQAVGVEDSSYQEVEQAQEKLSQAEQLISDGETDAAQEKIDEYVEIVEAAVNSGGETLGVVEALTEQADQTTKALSVKVPGNEELGVIQDAVNQAEEIVAVGEGDKNLKKVNNASDKLNMAASLIDESSYESALQYLQEYKDDVLEVATDISTVPLESRAQVVSEIFDNKIEDLHLLKIISEKLEDVSDFIDPALEAEVDTVKQQALYETNALVVSLKDRAISTISDFLEQVQADETIQIQVLSNLKRDVPMDFDMMKQINDIEDVYFDEGEVVVLISE
jgi:hypothetical protein